MDPHMFTRSDALREGFTVNEIDARVRSGTIHRLARGVYATDEPVEREAAWRRELAVVVARSRSPVAVSGIAAAILHRLDGYEPDFVSVRPVQLVTTFRGHVRHENVTRSRVFDPNAIVVIDGLPVLDLVATIAGLGAFVGPDVVEMALESVLRGEDTTKPDQWHPERLRALVDEVERHPRAPGRSEARLVLRRRGDVLPTGSAAETRGDLALRAAGVRLQRQARIRVYDGRGRLRHTYWVDFADVARRLALEIDGAHHRTAAGVRRDYRRDNVLGRAFEVCRYAADDVRRHPERFVLDVRRRLDATTPVAGPYRTDRGVLVRPNELGADVVDPTL